MNQNVFIRRACMSLMFSMLCLLSLAQTHQVSGIVKDVTGEPVIGVNVSVQGTGNGSITDLDGKFAIPNVKEKDVLIVSYIGYLTQSIPVGKQTSFTITLKEDAQALDEVVVIGYGTVKRRDLTGAIASVKGDEVAANPVSNVAQALQGRLPGVNVVSQDGRPGASVTVRVRGGGSIPQSNDPLYVVDGFPVGNISDIPASEF